MEKPEEEIDSGMVVEKDSDDEQEDDGEAASGVALGEDGMEDPTEPTVQADTTPGKDEGESIEQAAGNEDESMASVATVEEEERQEAKTAEEEGQDSIVGGTSEEERDFLEEVIAGTAELKNLIRAEEGAQGQEQDGQSKEDIVEDGSTVKQEQNGSSQDFEQVEQAAAEKEIQSDPMPDTGTPAVAENTASPAKTGEDHKDLMGAPPAGTPLVPEGSIESKEQDKDQNADTGATGMEDLFADFDTKAQQAGQDQDAVGRTASSPTVDFVEEGGSKASGEGSTDKSPQPEGEAAPSVEETKEKPNQRPATSKRKQAVTTAASDKKKIENGRPSSKRKPSRSQAQKPKRLVRASSQDRRPVSDTMTANPNRVGRSTRSDSRNSSRTGTGSRKNARPVSKNSNSVSARRGGGCQTPRSGLGLKKIEWIIFQ